MKLTTFERIAGLTLASVVNLLVGLGLHAVASHRQTVAAQELVQVAPVAKAARPG